jgi:hypothetical protein
MVLSLRWNRAYFVKGVPIFRTQLSAHLLEPALPSPDRMAERLEKSAFPPLVFHQLDETKLAFRERAAGAWLRIGYSPVMHGLLVFDRFAQRIEVTGLVNWWVPAFAIVFIAGVLAARAALMLAFLALVLGVIYLIQSGRFRQVAKVALEEWSPSARQVAGA